MRRGSSATALIAVAGAVLFVVALFLPFQTRVDAEPSVLDVAQGIRVWGSLALGPVAALGMAIAGAWLLMGRWTLRRAAGLIVGAGLWMTLRGAALVGVSMFREEGVSPALGAYVALAGGILVLGAGMASFARATAETGARSRTVCALTLVGTIVYVLANLVSAARVSPPGFEPSDLEVVNLSSPAATLVWESLLPAVVTVVLLLAAMRVLTGTAGGTGALLMSLGLVTVFQFAGILAWATSGAVEFLAPTAGVSVGIVAGALLFGAGLLSPTEPLSGPTPSRS
jgi:hypothetical protein